MRPSLRGRFFARGVALALAAALLIQPALAAARVSSSESSDRVSLTAARDAARDLTRPSGEGSELVVACEHAARSESRRDRSSTCVDATVPGPDVRATATRRVRFPPPLRRRLPPRGGTEGADTIP